MDTAAVFAMLVVCAFLIGRHMLRSLGIGMPGGKPDCGCGHCAEKSRGARARQKD